MEKTSHTYLAFKNISYNIVGYIWPMFFALFITPIIVFGLGVKIYGIYIFINTLLSLFGLLEFGLGTAVSKYIANYFGKKDFNGIRSLTHTANSLFLIIGMIGLVIAVIIARWGVFILPDRFMQYGEYFPLMALAGGLFLTTAIGSPFNSILNATQRFDIINYIGIASLTVSNLAILLVVSLGGSLWTIFFVQLIINVIFTVVTMVKSMSVIPEVKLRYEWNTFEIVRSYKFALVTSISNIANSALSYLDRMIIPLYAGPSNLTYYSIPGSVTNKIPGFVGTLSTTIFPTTSQLDGEQDVVRIQSLYMRSIRLITVIASALTITTICFAYKILYYWMGPNFAENSTVILVLLALTNYILAFYSPLSSFLLGLGKTRFLTTISITMGIVNAVCLFLLLPPYGILGAALAYLISVLPVLYIFFRIEKKYLQLSGRYHYYTRKLFGTIVTCIIVAIIDLLLSHLIVNLATLLFIGGTSFLLYIIVYKLLGFFSPTDWMDMEQYYYELKRKLKLTKAIK